MLVDSTFFSEHAETKPAPPATAAKVPFFMKPLLFILSIPER
jgi:hypothetical protein